MKLYTVTCFSYDIIDNAEHNFDAQLFTTPEDAESCLWQKCKGIIEEYNLVQKMTSGKYILIETEKGRYDIHFGCTHYIGRMSEAEIL